MAKLAHFLRADPGLEGQYQAREQRGRAACASRREKARFVVMAERAAGIFWLAKEPDAILNFGPFSIQPI